jgi:PleD family two-component response regulator
MEYFSVCHSIAGNYSKNNVGRLVPRDQSGSRSRALKDESVISGHLRPGRPDQPVILVADDEAAIRNIARFTLEEAGYYVLTAEDGEQALNLSRGFHGRFMSW